jgi:large subunit ribosomal protein L18
MDKAKHRLTGRKKRAQRVRKKVFGTPERPRLSVHRTLKHIYAQVIDDTRGRSLAQVGSAGKETGRHIADAKAQSKSAAAKIIGEMIAQKAIEKGITTVVFDRQGCPYSGRIKALADGARAKGLQF